MTESLISKPWFELLKEEFDKEYFKKLREELKKEYLANRCYPDPHSIFKVFQLCPPENVRVVIVGQDCYSNGHADGIAFSSKQKETPYSLQIIFREVDRDIVRTKDYKEFKEAFPNNDLTSWVKQGVFMLNTVLTVRAGETGSHSHLGWQQFTSRVLELLWANNTPKVFCGLGSDANKTLQPIVKDRKHYTIEAGHPASGAHGRDKYSGCNMFSKINRYFKLKGLPGIDWKLI